MTTTTTTDLRSDIAALLARGGIEPSLLEAARIVEAAGTDGRRAVALAERRVAGEPLQYLTGVAGFRRLDLAVGPGVFIPRPETEVVAEYAIAALGRRGTLVDVGTGSGAIALAVADERPDARVVATESSPAARSWAERNRDGLGPAVELISCDLLSGLPGELRGRVDVVVCNPPYIASGERLALPREVVDHEPHAALFGGHDGLDVTRRVAAQALGWLRASGTLVLEIGETQGRAVRRILAQLRYEDVLIHPDLAGRDRVALGRKARS